LKRHYLIACFACVLSLATWAHGQAVPTAARGGSIQVGIGGMFTKPDYATAYLKGLTFYADFDFFRHLGVEGDIHYSISTPGDISENSYLIGPRYSVRYKRLSGYGKALFGLGRFGYQQGNFVSDTTGNYGVYAFGGGVEYKATPHINVRPFDVEFQKWPNFTPHSLSPIVYTIGVAYVFR
jgi:hypothetical protein